MLRIMFFMKKKKAEEPLEPLEYYGTAEPLSVARGYLAATSVGDYALFGGGFDSSYRDTVDAYDTTLTRTTPTPLSVARNQSAATSVGDYALFGGGHDSSTYFNTVDVYKFNPI